MARKGFINVPGGDVYYQSVGEGGVPLLCVHGGPGFTSHYLEPLTDLGERREVIFYDQLGCGRSQRPGDVALWTVARFVEELATVREALDLPRVHLLGSSWGGMLAMQYVLDRRPELASLTLVGSPASMPRWSAECAQLLSLQSTDDQETIRRHEASGTTDCPEYAAAILGFYREHLCRLTPWPDGLERSFAEAGLDVYHHMNGPSEFSVTGTLARWDVTERLGEIDAPTLLIGGEHDECRPEHLREMQHRIPGSRLEIVPDASHLCFAEKREHFMAVVNEFLAGADD
ncbi:MAG: proline iminopeptidase-family hydrolase [Candidatus Dormibacteraeota bacterium]|uniref:Proline iminopeptidase n=1 Tax=Candidatus Aeolococcus gillhamiae TaxID=3127015 RepID=A0A934JUQ5_9BACT|nr:proline iminopeptidase-family hydrolase [Candidatus Dormibacteraeota bacterium]